jgi:hypothetical protein
MKVARGSTLTLHLSMPGVEIDEPIQTVTWHGYLRTAQFFVKLPEDFRLGDIAGTLRVSWERVPLGHVSFKLTVTAAPGAPSEPEPTGAGYAYRKAFVSYASEDRTEVPHAPAPPAGRPSTIPRLPAASRRRHH